MVGDFKFVFGPVPSRRLGFSLGINNIPYKICSYSCVYCQLGKTLKYSIERRNYGEPSKIQKEVKEVLGSSVKVDYITFVPDGEPTLDSSLGEIVDSLRSITDKPIAILTNSSLLWKSDVIEDVSKLDLVSVKIDSVLEDSWKRINRPHPSLKLDLILDGLMELSKVYKGEIITETMLVSGMNTDTSGLTEVAKFISKMNVSNSYIAIPVRPPAEKWVKKPSEKELVMAHEIFSSIIGRERVKLLNLPEPNRFEVAGEPIKYIVRLVSVHPLKLDYALKLLSKYFDNPDIELRKIIDKKLVTIIDYEGNKFIVRRFG